MGVKLCLKRIYNSLYFVLIYKQQSRSIYTITRIEPDYVEISTHGIPYNFDNRTGRWNIWNLSLFLDGAETKAREPGVFMNLPLIADKFTSLVMIKLVLKIDPKVYQLSFMETKNLKISKQLGEPGSTSYNVITKLIDSESEEVLVERLAKLGRIDNNSRRPVKNPEEFTKSFSHLKGKGQPPELAKTEIPTQPDNCHKWFLTTRYSDLDTKMHANQSLYIKSCIDCATEASLNGKLVYFTDDMIWYPVSFLSVNYLGESFVNDKLVVNMWQDKNVMSLLNFLVCRETKQLAFIQAKFDLNKITV